MLQRILNRRKPAGYRVRYVEPDGTSEIEIASTAKQAAEVADICKRDGCTAVEIKPLRWAWSVRLARYQQRRAAARSRPLFDPGRPNRADAGVDWADRACDELSAKMDGDSAATFREAFAEVRAELEGDDGITAEGLQAGFELLPPRHCAVMQMRVAGRTYHEIAAEMGESERTVLTMLCQSAAALRMAQRMPRAEIEPKKRNGS